MFQLTSLRLGVLFVIALTLWLSLEFHELIVPVLNVLLTALKVALGWLVFQLRRSILPALKQAAPLLAIFALPPAWAKRVHRLAQQLNAAVERLVSFVTTRHTWLTTQPVKVILAVVLTGIFVLLSFLLTGYWLIYVFGWSTIWKLFISFVLIPAIRGVEGLIFRTLSLMGLKRFWQKHEVVQKYPKTFAHRHAIKARRARHRVIRKVRKKLTKQPTHEPANPSAKE